MTSRNWFLSGAVERYQLDLDTESENGNESELVRIDLPCVVDTSPMTITLMWDQDDVDVDLYVWNFSKEETYQGSYYDGQRGRSSYGYMEVWDNEGRGPEVFKLNVGESGRFCVRAHVFCGPPVDTRIKARIQHWKNGAGRTRSSACSRAARSGSTSASSRSTRWSKLPATTARALHAASPAAGRPLGGCLQAFPSGLSSPAATPPATRPSTPSPGSRYGTPRPTPR
ncbi:MAG: hypothetical protein R3F43_14255 [bacterium]